MRGGEVDVAIQSKNLKYILESYKHFLKEDLIDSPENLDKADFVCAAHLYYPDEPKFIYGNQKALELWELTEDEFIGMPSRFTAEEVERDKRQKLLDEVSKNGYIKNYSGVRISSTGKRFRINNAVVWNLLNDKNQLVGQAVKFKNYEYL